MNNGSWSQVGANHPDNSQIYSLSVDTTGTVYVTTHNSLSGNPMPYITDYTQPWSSTAALLSASYGGLSAVSILNDTVYVGTGNGSIYYSADAASSHAVWTPIASQPDGQGIRSLLVNQNALSPIFVENKGVVPVGGSSTSVTVTNLSNTTVTDVHAQLPSSLSGVTQGSSGCASVAPQGSCTLTFASSEPYIPQNLAIVGSNTTNPIDRIALVFSMNGYLVYNVDTNTQTAYVMDNADLSSATWGGFNTDDIPGITEADTAGIGSCNGATDGKCDTQQIVTKYPSGTYAANLCNRGRVE